MHIGLQQENGIEANSRSEPCYHLWYFNQNREHSYFHRQNQNEIQKMIKQCDKFHYPLCVSTDQEMIESITNAEMEKKMTVKRSKNLKRNHFFV